MNCDEYQLLIEDYGDGAIDKKTAAVVTSHMATCARCASFSEELGREREIYARYQRDVEVTPVLWSSIEARIKQEQAGQPAGLMSRFREGLAGMFAAPRLSPALAALLVMIAIGVTVFVMSRVNSPDRRPLEATGNINAPAANTGGNDADRAISRPESRQAETSTIAKVGGSTDDTPKRVKVTIAALRRNLTSTAGISPAQLVREAEQKYLTAIAILSRDVNRHRSELDPIVLARFDAALGEIDRTIKETRRVVRENPGDPIALQYLLAAYSKKVDVLRGMTAD